MQWGFGNCLALVLPILLVATVVVKYDNWYEVIGCTVTDWYWYWLHWYWPFYKPASPLFLFLAFEARYSHQNPQSNSLLCKTHFLLSIALFSHQSKQSNSASQWNTFILPSWVAASSRFTIDQLTIQYLLLPFTTQIQIHIKVQSKIQNKTNAQIQIKIHEQSGSTSWPFNTCFHLHLHLHLHPCMQLHTAQVFPVSTQTYWSSPLKYWTSDYCRCTHIVLMSNQWLF